MGAAIVDAPTIMAASAEAHFRGCNPGGEMLAVRIPDDQVVPEHYMNRLLTIEECNAFDNAIGGDGLVKYKSLN